jgi:hypothetical protein
MAGIGAKRRLYNTGIVHVTSYCLPVIFLGRDKLASQRKYPDRNASDAMMPSIRTAEVEYYLHAYLQ